MVTFVLWVLIVATYRMADQTLLVLKDLFSEQLQGKRRRFQTMRLLAGLLAQVSHYIGQRGVLRWVGSPGGHVFLSRVAVGNDSHNFPVPTADWVETVAYGSG